MNRQWLWNGKPWQAFKTFAILFSFIMNFVLLLVLLFVAPLLLPILNDVAKPIVGGLDQSFEEMSTASITRTIKVEDTIPVQFVLPLSQQTNVVLSDDVPITVRGAQVLLGGGSVINGDVILSLPEGLVLPVQLDVDVPVDQELDVALSVDVEIPLSETQLGSPFNQLKGLFGPLNDLVDGLPDSNQELFDRIAGPQPAPEDEAAVSTSD